MYLPLFLYDVYISTTVHLSLFLSLSLSLSFSLSHTHTHTHTHIYIYIYIYVQGKIELNPVVYQFTKMKTKKYSEGDFIKRWIICQRFTFRFLH